MHGLHSSSGSIILHTVCLYHAAKTEPSLSGKTNMTEYSCILKTSMLNYCCKLTECWGQRGHGVEAERGNSLAVAALLWLDQPVTQTATTPSDVTIIVVVQMTPTVLEIDEGVFHRS